MERCSTAGEERGNGNQVYNYIKEENRYYHTDVCDLLPEVLDNDWTETCINKYDTSLVCKEEYLENGVNEVIVDPLLPTCLRTEVSCEQNETLQNVNLGCTKKISSTDDVHLENITGKTHVDCPEENSDIHEECSRVLASHLAIISSETQTKRERSIKSKNNMHSSTFSIIEEQTKSGIRKVSIGVCGKTCPEKDNTSQKQKTKEILESYKGSYNLNHRMSEEDILKYKTFIHRLITGPKLKNQRIRPYKDALTNKIKLVTGVNNLIQNKSLTRYSNKKNEDAIIEKNNFPTTNDNIVESETENIDAAKNKSQRNTKLGSSNKRNVEVDSDKFPSKRVTREQKNKIGPGVKTAKIIHKKSSAINKENDSRQNILPTEKQKIVNRNTNHNKVLDKVKSLSQTVKACSSKAKLDIKQKIILASKKQYGAKSKRKLPANENNNNTQSPTVTEKAIQFVNTDNIEPANINNIHTDYINIFKNKYICDICGYQASTKKYIQCHLQVHSGKKKILFCKCCSYITNSKTRLNNHIITHTGEKRFTCPMCDRKFARNYHLKLHMKIHTGDKPYSCDLCDYRCNRKSLLTPHKITHSDEKPFSCLFCSFKTARKEAIVVHMKSHTGEKRYHCDICNFKFIRKQCLINHIMIHNKIKPFACKYCTYKCVRKNDLVAHERIHTGDRPYACKICNFKSIRKITLSYHMRIHTGERPFSCKLCNYKGKQHHQLIVHMRTHTGEKPFMCKECDYRCADKSSLNKHKRVHTQEKPYVCKECNTRFKESSTLRRHIKAHTSEKKFWCALCQFKSVQKCDLVNHMKRHDKKKIQQIHTKS